MNDISQHGGPQMVQINGALVRQFREERGLTQLYVATVVEVTTDTISRWENRRYPSVKLENAEKLAEALQVGLADILDNHADPETKETDTAAESLNVQPDNKKTLTLFRSLLFVALLLAGLGIAAFLVIKQSALDDPATGIRAIRILPPHVPPGQTFPVIIKVTSTTSQPVSIVLRDTVPPGCKTVTGQPTISSTGKDNTLAKWVTRIETGMTFAYLVKSPSGASENSEMVFSGQLLPGPGSGKTIALSGGDLVLIRNFHWADTNMDYQIDDEEILAVYDLFSEISGFEFKGEQLDELWAADRYSYDSNNNRYEVGQ